MIIKYYLNRFHPITFKFTGIAKEYANEQKMD